MKESEIRETDVLQSTTICSESFVERDGVTLVIFTIRNARRNHPVFLLLRGDLPRRRSQNRCGRRRRTSRNLLPLVLGRFERIFDDVDHLNNSLLLSVSSLLSRRVSYVGNVSLSSDGGGGLSGLDLSTDEFLEGSLRSSSGRLDFLLGRSFHGSVLDVGTMGEGDEIFELRLYCSTVSMSLLGCCGDAGQLRAWCRVYEVPTDGVVTYVPFCVDLEGESISICGLNWPLERGIEQRLGETTDLLLAPHLEGELGKVRFGIGSSVCIILLLARSPVLALSVGWDRARGGGEGQRCGRGGEGRLWRFFGRGSGISWRRQSALSCQSCAAEGLLRDSRGEQARHFGAKRGGTAKVEFREAREMLKFRSRSFRSGAAVDSIGTTER